MFLTFEGIDGSSKTTQAKLLSSWLKDRGVEHILTKEPGTVISKECQQIRKLILDPDNNIAARTEFFLYLADRAQHVEKVIRPALGQKLWVISDRYVDSTRVYQGVGRNLGLDKVNPMIDYASHGFMPDITFVMDVPAEVGVARALKANTEFAGGDRMELEHMSFHNRLREGFLELSKSHDRYIVLDATKSIEDLHMEVVDILGRFV